MPDARKVIEAVKFLMEESPIRGDDPSGQNDACIFCGPRAPFPHAKDCAWVTLRDALAEYEATEAQARYHVCGYNIDHGRYCGRPKGHHGKCMTLHEFNRKKACQGITHCQTDLDAVHALYKAVKDELGS